MVPTVLLQFTAMAILAGLILEPIRRHAVGVRFVRVQRRVRH